MQVPICDSEECGDAGIVSKTSTEFRDHFYRSYNDVSRRERKERIKKYGNLKGESAEEMK